MSLNGSGVFNVNTAGQPVVSGTLITAAAFNAVMQDIATALSTALYKDGQQVNAANQAMGGFKLTGLGAGSSNGESVRYEQLADKPGENYIINSDMLFAQRGTSGVKTAAGYQLDRWQLSADGTFNITVSQQALGAGDIEGYRFNQYHRYVVNSASGQTYCGIGQGIENVKTLSGKAVTVSFWAKGSSAITVTPQVKQVFGGGGSTSVTNGGSAITVSTSWVRYSQTITLDSISGKTIGTDSHLALLLFGPTNTAYTLDITGVKLEVGSVATDYEIPDILTSALQCRRFYETAVTSLQYNYEAGTVRLGGYVFFKANKLKTPTMTCDLGTPGLITSYGFRVDDNTTTGNWYSPTWIAEAEFTL